MRRAGEIWFVGLLWMATTTCSIETTPLSGRAPRGDGDADADADADGDGDADADGDTDADGDADPGCREGATRVCGSDVGDCRPGQETCRGAVWGACEGATVPRPQQCDGRDEDCDGLAGPDDGDADGACGDLHRCLRLDGQARCTYYAPCVSAACCDSDPCFSGYDCRHISFDCDLCETCVCNLCVRR